MEINKVVGTNIRKMRTMQDIKQEDLADDLGKSRRWLGDVENGQTDIKLSDLHNVAEKYRSRF